MQIPMFSEQPQKLPYDALDKALDSHLINFNITFKVY